MEEPAGVRKLETSEPHINDVIALPDDDSQGIVESGISASPPADRPSFHRVTLHPPNWRDPRRIGRILTEYVSSPEPGAAFATLANLCAPRLSDECVAEIDEARDHAPGASQDSHSVCVRVAEEACGGAPGYRARVEFRWREPCVDDVDRVIAELLVARIAAQVRHERLAAALDVEIAKSINLAEALTSNRHIGQAIGILMSAYKLTSEQAFDQLREASQRSHRKLREVATMVNETGQLPGRSAEHHRRD